MDTVKIFVTFLDKVEELHNKYFVKMLLLSIMVFTLYFVAGVVYRHTQQDLINQRFIHLESVIDSMPFGEYEVIYQQPFVGGFAASYRLNIITQMSEDRYEIMLDYLENNGWSIVEPHKDEIRASNNQFFLLISKDRDIKNKWYIHIIFNDMWTKLQKPFYYSDYSVYPSIIK